MKWAEAVKAWNAKHNAGGKYRIPGKGTDAYKEVMRMMGKEPDAPSEPRAPAPDDRPKKMERVMKFLSEVAKKRKADREAAGAAEAAERGERSKLLLKRDLAELERMYQEQMASVATTDIPRIQKARMKVAVGLKSEINKLKKRLKESA